jgi:hypothetical protein
MKIGKIYRPHVQQTTRHDNNTWESWIYQIIMRQKASRLLLFYKVIHQTVAIPVPDHLQQPSRRTRQYHHRRFVRLGVHEEQRKNGFFVRTIEDWNDLPPDILNLDDYEAFKTHLIALRNE